VITSAGAGDERLADGVRVACMAMSQYAYVGLVAKRKAMVSFIGKLHSWCRLDPVNSTDTNTAD